MPKECHLKLHADLLHILISNFKIFWPKTFAPVWLGNRLIYAGLEPVQPYYKIMYSIVLQ